MKKIRYKRTAINPVSSLLRIQKINFFISVIKTILDNRLHMGLLKYFEEAFMN